MRLPALQLVCAAVEATMLILADQAATARLISTKVAAFTQRALKAMFAT
jgi:hypothetical protein